MNLSVSTPAAVPAPAGAAARCHHCGDAVATPGRFRTKLGGVEREFCCAGCEAVATTIARAGLADFYERRREAARPLEAESDYASFDAPAVGRAFVRELADGSREASLMLEGIRCAACVWLNEAHLQRLPGVVSASVNYATRRALVRWRPERTRLSAILSAIAAIGYRAHPYDPAAHEALARREGRSLLLRAAIAALAMMQVMMFAVPGYLSVDGVDAEYDRLFRWSSLIMTVPAVFFSGWPFIAGAWRSVRRRSLGMDVPVALGILVAFGASAWSTLSGTGAVYFDSVTMFIALLLAARYVELRVRHRTAAVVETLAASVPATAERLIDYPRSLAVERVPASEVAPGDPVLVRPGAAVPADGRVEAGTSHVDESIVTGESWPIAKAPGSAVLAGSVNRESQLVVRVTCAADASRVSQVARLVERALSERPALAVAADRVAAWSVAGVLAADAAAAAYWWLVDPAVALPAAVAVLVVSCPCALSLAVPAGLAASTASLARRGVLVTRGHAIEAVAGVTDVAFDKTGTLTEGGFSLVGVFALADVSAERAIGIAAALEAASEHPIAAALRAQAGPALPAPQELKSIAGAGVEGRIDGKRWRLGSPEWIVAAQRLQPPLESHLLAAHVTPVALADERGWVAWFTFSDRIREGSRSAVSELRARGLRVHLLSGDRPATVSHHGNALAVDTATGGLQPEGKLDWLRACEARGNRVLMVGDGVNDAPVLAGAAVSVAVAGASPLAMQSADVVLLGAGPRGVVTLVHEARRALAVIRENFAWAILYNVIAIPLAASHSIGPLAAGIGMSLSSLLVVLNSLRLVAAARKGQAAGGAASMRQPAVV